MEVTKELIRQITKNQYNIVSSIPDEYSASLMDFINEYSTKKKPPHIAGCIDNFIRTKELINIAINIMDATKQRKYCKFVSDWYQTEYQERFPISTPDLHHVEDSSLIEHVMFLVNKMLKINSLITYNPIGDAQMEDKLVDGLLVAVSK